MTKVLNSLQAAVINANINFDEKKLEGRGLVKIRIHNSDQLANIISSLKSVPGVNNVERVNSVDNNF
jgi:(p)ppGpp synthase/HD superfamily hydrolase